MNLSNKIKTFGKLGDFKFKHTTSINNGKCPKTVRCTNNCTLSDDGNYIKKNYVPSNLYDCVDPKTGLPSNNKDCINNRMFKKQTLFTDNPSHKTWQLNNINTLQHLINFDKELDKPCTSDNFQQLNYFNGSMSDRLSPKEKSEYINVPSSGNSSHTSKTNHRPGASTPNTYGVDIKHGSYDRYMLKLKGKTRNTINKSNQHTKLSTALYGNKTYSPQISYNPNSSILNSKIHTCGDPITACND